MIGNHLDAWIFGAADPSSGTAVLLGITRAFGHLKATKGFCFSSIFVLLYVYECKMWRGNQI